MKYHKHFRLLFFIDHPLSSGSYFSSFASLVGLSLLQLLSFASLVAVFRFLIGVFWFTGLSLRRNFPSFFRHVLSSITINYIYRVSIFMFGVY